MPRLALLVLCVLSVSTAARSAITLVPLRTPEAGHLSELRIEGAPVADNNFDPDQIAIDVTITGPTQQSLTIPAFWFQDFSRALVAGAEVLTPTGEAGWRLRFTPAQAGNYALALHVRQGNQTLPVVTSELDVAAGPVPHFVSVAANHRDLEEAPGKPLRLSGANVCWPEARGTYDYDTWFAQMHASGENFARLWLCPWWAGLEHKPGTLTRFPLDEAWRLDHVFSAAEENSLFLLLCLDHHGMYQTNNKNWGGKNNFWAQNPYAEVNGGPCTNPNDFFTDARARDLYKKRLRYLIARYGASTRLLAWQFFNEIDNTFTQQVNGGDVIAWHQLMARWLRNEDPYHHLITTSLTGGSDRAEFWSLPEMDLSMYHSYSDPAPGRKLAALARDYRERYNKPVMIGEFGVDAASWNIATDPHLRGFRQSLWASALGGSVGTGMSWWWQDLHRDRVYPLYEIFNRLMADAGWQEGAWSPVSIGNIAPQPIDIQKPDTNSPRFNATLLLNTGRRLPLSGTVAIPSPLAAERASEFLSAFIYGTKNPALPQTLTVHAWFAENARVSFRVNAVASDNQLLVRSNGRELFRTGFSNIDGLAQLNHEIDRDFTVDLPSGEQTLEFSNIGTDWTGLDSIRLENAVLTSFSNAWTYEPEASVLRSANRAVVYVTSPHTVYPAGRLLFHPPLITDKSLSLPDWPEGKVTVVWTDPATGSQVASTSTESHNHILTLNLPPFEDDLVGVVKP